MNGARVAFFDDWPFFFLFAAGDTAERFANASENLGPILMRMSLNDSLMADKEEVDSKSLNSFCFSDFTNGDLCFVLVVAFLETVTYLFLFLPLLLWITSTSLGG